MLDEPLIESRLSRLSTVIRECPHCQRSYHDNWTHCPACCIALNTGKRVGPRFSKCLVCGQIERGVYDHLAKFQYRITIPGDVQRALASNNGLCEFHTWQYDMIASPRGTCLAFAPVLEHISAALHKIAHGAGVSSGHDPLAGNGRLQANAPNCELCHVRDELEQSALSAFAINFDAGEHEAPTLCLPHFRSVAGKIADPAAARRLIERQAALAERLSEDMRRYVLRLDGVRRSFITTEEHTAAHGALTLLAGHRNVRGAIVKRDDRF